MDEELQQDTSEQFSGIEILGAPNQENVLGTMDLGSGPVAQLDDEIRQLMREIAEAEAVDLSAIELEATKMRQAENAQVHAGSSAEAEAMDLEVKLRKTTVSHVDLIKPTQARASHVDTLAKQMMTATPGSIAEATQVPGGNRTGDVGNVSFIFSDKTETTEADTADQKYLTLPMAAKKWADGTLSTGLEKKEGKNVYGVVPGIPAFPDGPRLVAFGKVTKGARDCPDKGNKKTCKPTFLNITCYCADHCPLSDCKQNRTAVLSLVWKPLACGAPPCKGIKWKDDEEKYDRVVDKLVADFSFQIPVFSYNATKKMPELFAQNSCIRSNEHASVKKICLVGSSQTLLREHLNKPVFENRQGKQVGLLTFAAGSGYSLGTMQVRIKGYTGESWGLPKKEAGELFPLSTQIHKGLYLKPK